MSNDVLHAGAPGEICWLSRDESTSGHSIEEVKMNADAWRMRAEGAEHDLEKERQRNALHYDNWKHYERDAHAARERCTILEREAIALRRRTEELFLQLSQMVAVCTAWCDGNLRARKAMRKIWELV